jgi:curved DNA-binding protein CbpA
LSEEEVARIQEVSAAKSHYAAMGLSPGASRETVESAYRAYVREWHPDRFFSRECGEHKPTIEQNFVDVTRAYEVLRDDRKRREYDQELLTTGKMPAAPRPPVRRPEPPVPGHEVVFGKPKAEPPPPPAPSPPPPNPAIQRLRAQLAEQNAKAMTYFRAAQVDFEGGHFVKAEGALYLALKLSPQNQEFQALYQKAQEKAKQQRADTLIHQAEQAEQYGRGKEALGFYQRACECEPNDGKAWFHQARLRKALGEDDAPKDLLQLYKKAALKSPKNFEYRMAAAEGYALLGMNANANREALAALELDPKSDAAKALVKKTRS